MKEQKRAPRPTDAETAQGGGEERGMAAQGMKTAQQILREASAAGQSGAQAVLEEQRRLAVAGEEAATGSLHEARAAMASTREMQRRWSTDSRMRCVPMSLWPRPFSGVEV